MPLKKSFSRQILYWNSKNLRVFDRKSEKILSERTTCLFYINMKHLLFLWSTPSCGAWKENLSLKRMIAGSANLIACDIDVMTAGLFEFEWPLVQNLVRLSQLNHRSSLQPSKRHFQNLFLHFFHSITHKKCFFSFCFYLQWSRFQW